MSKTFFPRESADLQSVLKSARVENLNYPQLFDWIGGVIPMAEGVIITTLPRGSLQIAQPPRVSEPLLRAYTRDFHAFDRPSWQAISTGRAVRGTDCWRSADEFEASRFRNEFLRPNGYEFVAAAPLSAPVLAGYPGAIQLYRTSEQGPFSDSELAHLADIARQLDEEIERARSGR